MNYLTILQAFDTPKILDIEKSRCHKFLATQISKAYALCGLRLEKDDLFFMATELHKELMSNYSFLHQGEVEIIIERGAKGEFCENFGINTVTLISWFKHYLVREEYKRAKQELIKIDHTRQLTQRTELTEEEGFELLKENVLDKFDDYRCGRKRLFFDMGNCAYDFLERIGLIEFSREDKYRIYERAKELREAELALKGRVRGKQRLGSIISGDKFTLSGVGNKAKEIALSEFFDNLIERGVELSDLLCAQH